MEIGIIFGIFPVGSIFISTIFGKYMHFWGFLWYILLNYFLKYYKSN